MCLYRYVFYSRCQHAELIKIHYCDRAKELGWPQWDSIRYLRDDTRRRANIPDLSARYPPCEPASSRDAFPPPATYSMVTSSGPRAAAHSWADDVVQSETEPPSHAHLMPRSLHSDSAAPAPAGGDESTCTVESEGASMLEIGIPMENCSSISMRLRHHDGKVKEIIARFESYCEPQGYHEPHPDEPVADETQVHADDGRTRTSSSATVRHYEPDRDISAQDSDMGIPCPTLHPTPGGQHPIDTGYLDTTTRGDGKGTDAETDTGLEQESSQSPRKSKPKEMAAVRSRGPQLSTARRAVERESRKKPADNDASTASKAKTHRSTRSSTDLRKEHGADTTAFLTKNAAAAVEVDITASGVPKDFRRIKSKATLKSPTVSPSRDHAKQKSPPKVPSSPTKSGKFAAHGFLTAETYHPSGRSGPSSVASEEYYSAMSEVSTVSYITASESQDLGAGEHNLKSANRDKPRQLATSIDGPKPREHHEGKSDPPFMAPTGTGKGVSTKQPKLSLKIPHTKNLAADRKPPFALPSATSSASASPVSPSSSSRIPRKSTSSKVNQEIITAPTTSYSGPLARTKSTKTLTPKPVNPDAVGGPAIAKGPSVEEPCDIPLPSTPAPSGPLRHVKTLNSEGTTPIISRVTPRRSSSSSLAYSVHDSLEGEDVVASTTPTDDPPLGKHDFIASYIEKHARTQCNQPHPRQNEPTSCSETEADAQASVEVNPLHGLLSDRVASELSHSEQWLLAASSRSCNTRIASDSDATIRATSFAKFEESDSTFRNVASLELVDPMLNDPGIVFSRKKSLVSGSDHGLPNDDDTGSHPEPAHTDVTQEETSSVTSAVTELNRTAEIWQHTSPVRGRKQQSQSASSPREGTMASARSSLLSQLRATAPDFVPQQESTAPRPGLPTEWTNMQPQYVYENPFGVDQAGNPYYYSMYPVPINPGTIFDFTTYRPRSASPSKKKPKGKKKAPPNQRVRPRDQTDDWNFSPTKGGDPEERKEAQKQEKALTKNETTPRAAHASLPQDMDPKAGEVFTEPPEMVSRSPTPFRYQLENLNVEPASRHCGSNAQDHERPAIDWSTVHNVGPANFRQPPHNATPSSYDPRGYTSSGRAGRVPGGFGHYTMPAAPYPRGQSSRQPYRQQPGNGLYDRPGYGYGGGRYRNAAAAGFPLDSTTPFPDPVPPPVPQRSGIPKEYLGYSVDDKIRNTRKPSETCGRVVIEFPATEMVGGVPCNGCEPDH
ncbi:hypothetical protein BCR34DRAFT_604050 [Clohesyomyces aquaticus]|uniref:Uncharacterized protein n=1 Tax=Clohesyomyces aquaticus TaxID=1231657 RepID=A0A1Y1Z9D0_9PLEO|nr:hypothetical protein BCR34DRAFT_604050 [Clohesyomyces aquaticus]